MSSTSIARQNRRLQKQLTAKLASSSGINLSPNNSSISYASKSYEVSTDDKNADDTKFNSDLPSESAPSTTGCSFINCDVSSRPIGKVFIEDDRGFRVVDANQMELYTSEYLSLDSSNNELAIFVAYKAAKIFQNFSLFCHGLLGGMSLIHLLLLIHLVVSSSSEEENFRHFGFLSKPIHNIFNFVCMICCISAFDRLDMADIKNSFKRRRKIFTNVCLIFIYPVCLLMSLSTVNVDEKLWLPNTNVSSWELFTSKDTSNEIFYWKTLSMLKCVGSLIGWIVFCLNPHLNIFLSHLKNICIKNKNIH